MNAFADIDPELIKTPRACYRKMRPECFSDSYKTHKLSRELFGFELSKLSTDMKQDEFEHFACRVISRLVTPNIIPPTGPNGGGDGKVDFETYVVDDDISCKWYIAGGCRENQRWAFAVSCKEKWEDKIKSDIENAKSTGKHFDRFFFCTNQHVSSQKRLKIYSKFKEQYSIETTILDFDWFVKAVFDEGCYQIAIESLNLSRDLDEVVEKGPLDTKRSTELKQIEERIINHVNQKGFDTEYVADLIRAAILARELELPWTEIVGRFYRAIREAEKHGMTQQLFEAHYQLGWTEFYWHEDPMAMYEQYVVLKGMLQIEVNPSRIERAMNLLRLLNTACNVGLVSENDVDIEKENTEWNDLCQTIIDSPKHSATAHYITIQQIESQLLNAIAEGKPIDDLLKELKDSLEGSLQYIDIDIEEYNSMIETISPYIGENTFFEDLVDRVAEIVREKKGDAYFAQVHYKRGAENIQKDQYVAAIKHLGQSIAGFQQASTMEYLIRACWDLAYAFEKVDLLQASNVFLVRALSMLYHVASVQGQLTNRIVGVLSALSRVALRQGDLNGFLNRYAPILSLMEAAPNIRDMQCYQEICNLDVTLSCLIHRSNGAGLPAQMPDVLKRFGLQASSDMLLYKWGNEEICSDLYRDIKGVSNEWENHWTSLLPEDYFLYPLNVYNKDKIEIKTTVKGCAIVGECSNDFKTRNYTALLLALVESYFATAELEDVSFITPHIHLTVQNKDGAKTNLEALKKSYEYRITVDWNQAEQEEIDEMAVNFLSHVLTRNAIHQNEEEFLKKKEQQEKIGERLSVMTNFLQDADNSQVYPYVPTLLDWVNGEDKEYAIKSDDTIIVKEEARGHQANSIITNVIDIPLWEKADWRLCAYMLDRQHELPPIMVFLFRDIQYGKQIFEAWEESLKRGELSMRISVVTGIDKDHPTCYKVQVSPDVEEMSKDENLKQRYMMTITRYRRIDVLSDDSMRMFQRDFERLKVAGITAAEIDDNGQMSQDIEKRYQRVIPIHNIMFREAWTIGENDVDMSAIQGSDNPIIPEEHKEDAPILKVLESKRKIGL